VDFLPAWVVDLSPGATLLVVVLMLLTGKIASRREVDAEKSRADTWQAAWQAERTASKEKDDQNAELLENSRTMVRVLRALQRALEARDATAPDRRDDPS